MTDQAKPAYTRPLAIVVDAAGMPRSDDQRDRYLLGPSGERVARVEWSGPVMGADPNGPQLPPAKNPVAANAALFAAAPDMHHALVATLSQLEQMNSGSPRIAALKSLIASTIAKAEPK